MTHASGSYSANEVLSYIVENFNIVFRYLVHDAQHYMEFSSLDPLAFMGVYLVPFQSRCID